MSNSIKNYTSKTLAAWDEVAPRHASINSTLSVDVTKSTFNTLNTDFNTLIDNHNIKGKSVAQVCCNNGIDLLSIKNKGAGRCLGIDGSQPFIDQAVGYANAAEHGDIEFICTDIYDLPITHQHAFDVVVTTVGVIGWMPDLNRYMEIIASLLNPGGHLFMEELHPILSMYEQGAPSALAYSYFDKEPFIESNGLDYFNHEAYDAKETVSFHHPISDIFNAAIASGLQLQHMQELSYNIGNYCADLEHSVHNPPLGMILNFKMPV